MSRAKIEFNLADLDDAYEFRLACKAHSMYSCLDEYKQYLRDVLKYGSHGFHDEEMETVEKLQEALAEIMTEHDVFLDAI
jgi:hypothetical protein